MKKYRLKKIFAAIAAFAVAVSFTGCLDDDFWEEDNREYDEYSDYAMFICLQEKVSGLNLKLKTT